MRSEGREKVVHGEEVVVYGERVGQHSAEGPEGMGVVVHGERVGQHSAEGPEGREVVAHGKREVVVHGERVGQHLASPWQQGDLHNTVSTSSTTKNYKYVLLIPYTKCDRVWKRVQLAHSHDQEIVATAT